VKVAEFTTRPNTKSILTVKGVSIQVQPNHIFTYRNIETEQVGGIWFVADLKGFTNEELQIYTELLYKYLEMTYSKEHLIDTDFCIAVDVVSQKEFKYTNISKSSSDSILDLSVIDLKSFLK
jgi:hypothetical protein